MPRPTPPAPVDEFLSTAEAAELLGVHPSTVRNWAASGRLIPVYRTRGDHRRYRRGDVLALRGAP